MPILRLVWLRNPKGGGLQHQLVHGAQGLADPFDPEFRNKRVHKINEWMNEWCLLVVTNEGTMEQQLKAHVMKKPRSWLMVCTITHHLQISICTLIETSKMQIWLYGRRRFEQSCPIDFHIFVLKHNIFPRPTYKSDWRCQPCIAILQLSSGDDCLSFGVAVF